MNALVRKEVRVIAPAWGVALVAMAAGSTGFAAFSIEAHAVCLMTFWLAMTLLGLSSFGREFSSGAFSALLAQPIARERLWQVKSRWVGVAGASLFGLSLFLWTNLVDTQNVASDWGMFLAGTAVGLAMLTGGLWTTLLFRQVTAAFWMTLLIPGALAAGVLLLVAWLAPVSPESWTGVAIFTILLLYSIAGYWWARRLFLTAQDGDWTPSEISMPRFTGWLKADAGATGGSPYRPLRALVAKELQLHSLSLFFAAGVLALHLTALCVRKLTGDWSAWRGLAAVAFVFWFILPLIWGAEVVGSERQLGTMEGQLCLPVRRRTQFALKLLFTLLAGVVLGGVMPWLLEHAARMAGIVSELETNRSMLLWFSATAAALAMISLYASSLTRSTLQSLGGAVVCTWAVWVLANWGSPDAGTRVWRPGLAHLIGGPALAVVLAGLSYWNFKRLHHARQLWRRNLAVLGAWLALTVVVTPLVHHRAWELVLPLEPRHGPARISSGGHAELCRVARPNPLAYLILLPDGRMWAGTEGDIVAPGEIRLTAGRFLDVSNWTGLAATSFRASAIKRDGSLWDVCTYSPPAMQVERHLVATLLPPQRIGTDSDWKSLSAGGTHFLALKQDGSLWGWGDNSYNQLGEGPKQFTNGPVRLGHESDWTAVFASGMRSAAVKRDGSVWMWGGLYHLPDGTLLNQVLRQPAPLRWNLPATNLVSLHNIWTAELALYRDGSAWAVGRVPLGLVTDSAAHPGSEEAEGWEAAAVAVTPILVNEGENWRALVSGQSLTMLHGDGSLWGRKDWWSPRESHQTRKVSKHSDWVAVAAQDYETYARWRRHDMLLLLDHSAARR